MHRRLAAALLLPGLVLCNPAKADSTINYSLNGGWTSNIFKDTTRLPASFGEAKLALRGSLALEDSHLAYALTTRARRVPRYRFADERVVGAELGYRRDLGQAVQLTLRGGIEHRRDGDLFLALPGLTIGYRKNDVLLSGSAGLTVEHWEGKSHATAAVAALHRGRADFTLRGLPRVQMEARHQLFELTGGHIRPLIGGEIGATLQYRTSRIPGDEQQRFERFPAHTLRGSFAYGRAFGETVTLMAEAGMVVVHSPELSGGLDPSRPFLKAELAWKVAGAAVLKATLTRDIVLTDIDDPLGEDVRTVGLSFETPLSERLSFGLAYEQAYSDWLYYDYRTRTTSAAATLTYTLTKGAAVALEYSHLVRRETDQAADFTVDGLSARFSGSF